MKKILTSLLLILLICFNCLLSACSLVTLNNTKYMAAIVASTDGVKITMEDFITGYNSMAANYLNSGYYTTEQAVKMVLENLIDRELLYNKAVKVLEDELKAGGEDAYTADQYKNGLTLTEQNEVWKEVYDYVNSQVKEYADEIIESEELELPEEQEEDEDEEETTGFTPYEKTYKKVIENDNTVYKRVYETRKEKDTDTQLLEFSLNEYGIEGLATRAFSKYINAVKKGRDTYKNLSNDEIFEQELERIYKVYEKNKVLQLFSDKYENEVGIDLDAIKEKYVELVKNSAFTYYLNEESYNSKMQESANEVYYQPFGDKYIQVAHILLQYSDEQSAKIKELKSDLKNGGIDIDEYNQQIKNIANAIKVDNKSVNEIYTEVVNTLNACGNNDELKVQKFIELIEKYNQDEGMLTAINEQTQYYTINLDTSVTDTMVKEFADASRALYSADGSLDFTVYAQPVLTEYGYHIIFSLGAVKNSFNSLSDVENVAISYLEETPAMMGTNKSLFDKMLELVDESQYSEYQSSLIMELRDGLTIKYNKSLYERLYK